MSILDNLAPSAVKADQPLVLEQGRAERNYWRDLFAYRELFFILAWRDVAVRYKQTLIGAAWAVIRPLLAVLIFTIVFGRVAKLPTDGEAPYPLLVFAGMLPWYLFSTVLSEAANSLVGNANLIGKVYFPRVVVPTSVCVVALVDFGITFLLFLGMMAWFDFYPDWRILFLPLFILFALATSLGPALLLSALNVRYRDFRFIVPFIIQFGVYVSPVGFSSSVIPDQWRFLYNLNPVVALIDGFRWCTLAGESQLHPETLISGLVVMMVALWVGFTYFRATERTFADLM